MIDHISDCLFTTSAKARAHLEHEAVSGQIIETGNPIVDASRLHLNIALERYGQKSGLIDGRYAILTAHREENVDDRSRLWGILEGASLVAEHLALPIHFLAHPRTQKRLREFGLEEPARRLPGLCIRDGAAYLEFLALLARAQLVLTDSGGVQQEACIHRVRCVTLRGNTEWTETIEIGANRLAGTDPQKILQEASQALSAKVHWEVPFGDGHAAEHIVEACARALAEVFEPFGKAAQNVSAIP